MHGVGVTGTLPASWGNGSFPSLTHLQLINTSLSGPLQQEWGTPMAFKSLSDLTIAISSITGNAALTWQTVSSPPTPPHPPPPPWFYKGAWGMLCGAPTWQCTWCELFVQMLPMHAKSLTHTISTGTSWAVRYDTGLHVEH